MRYPIVTRCFLVLAFAGTLCCGAREGAAQATQPPPSATPTPLRLSLKQAVEIALAPDGNAKVRLAAEIVRQTEAQTAQVRAALLPNLDASVGQQSQTRNLEALGLGINFPPNPFFTFPRFIGPFNTFDARVTARQTVFDWSLIRRFQASRAGLGIAEAEQTDTEDRVTADVARAYLTTLRSEASLAVAQADVDLSKALVDLAENQKRAGTGTGIEITRARVQLADGEQRLLVARNERTRAYLLLLRLIGVYLETPTELTEQMARVPVQAPTPAEALALALRSRADWLAQQKRLQAAQLTYSSVKSERLPSVAVFGDYGSSGLSINNSLPTRTYGFTVRVPVFDGGARDARRAQSSSQLRQEEVRSEDLRAQIELDVRLALDNLASAEEQVKTAEEGLALAESELAQARRRYEAGVSIGLEVTDAQTRLERAQENRVLALYNHNLARIALAAATGTIRRLVQ
jgi:outer membrane protein